MPWREACREELLVPVARDHTPAVARELVGEILGIADAKELQARAVAEAPRRKRSQRSKSRSLTTSAAPAAAR